MYGYRGAFITLRRDCALWKEISPSLAPNYDISLRHAPFIRESSVFPQGILDNIAHQRHSDEQKTLLESHDSTSTVFVCMYAEKLSA